MKIDGGTALGCVHVHYKVGEKVSMDLLEEKGPHTAHFTLLLYKDLKVLVDDGNSQQDTRSRPYSTKEICHDRQATNTEPTKGSCCGNVPRTHIRGDLGGHFQADT